MSLMADLRDQKRFLELEIRQSIINFEMATGVKLIKLTGEFSSGVYYDYDESSRPLLISIKLEEI